MANKQHLIEINGKLYDAVSGKPAGHQSATPTKTIDGVSRPVAISVQQASDQKTAPAQHRRNNQQRSTHQAKHASKTAQKSQTLMRSAVKKPLSPKQPGSQHSSGHNISKPGKVSPHRLSRAEKTSKSNLVSRFASGQPKRVEPKIMAMPVQNAPSTASATLSASQMRKPEHPKLNVEKALNAASSHNQPKAARLRRRPSSRLVKYGSAIAAVLILGGYFAYNSLPHISMQIASTRAGIDASLPDYQPAGFDLSNNITYSPGEITINYDSNSDDRSFSLTQTATELDEQKLLKEQVATDNKPYQTLEQQGKTVYIKGNDALWLDNGKLYQIEGNTALSSDQLLRVANSL